MEAITRMECRLLHGYDLDFSPNKWRWKFGPALNLLLFLLLLLVILLLFLVLLLGSLLSRGLLLTLRSLRISGLLPGRTPNHLGSFLAGRFENSANFSFHIDSSHSARITSAPPSYNFLRSP